MNSSQNDNNTQVVLSIDKNLKICQIFSDCVSCKSPTKETLIKIVNKLGEESSQAQCLKIPITSTSKFQLEPYNNDLIYLLFNLSNQVFEEIGFLRFGHRNLYFDDGVSLKHIPNCFCILDFYVRFKRKGFGKKLFDLVLKQNNFEPRFLAYDRPSKSMLSFLKRHYSLDQPLWQHNHFVIFSGFFTCVLST